MDAAMPFDRRSPGRLVQDIDITPRPCGWLLVLVIALLMLTC